MKRQALKVFMEDLPTNTKTPILSYCRKLLKQGSPEDTEVGFYRKDRRGVQVKVNNIGLAALLSLAEGRQVGPRFVKYRKMDLGSQKI